MLKKYISLRSIQADKARLEVFRKKTNIFNAFSREEIKTLFSYIRPYLRGIIFLIILALGLSFLEGFKALSVVAFIKSLFLDSVDFLNNMKIFGKYAVTDFIQFSDKNMLIMSIFSAFIVLSITAVAVKFFIALLTRKFQLTLMRDLRRDLFNKIVLFNIDFLNEAKSGELLFMINSEVSRFSSIILHFKIFISSISTLLIFLGILFVMQPAVTSVIFILGASFLIGIQGLQKRLWASSWQVNLHQNTLQQIFYNIIYGMKLIKLGGLENRERDEYVNQHLKYEKQDKRSVKLRSSSDAIRELFFIGILAIVTFAFFYLINKGILIKDGSFVLSYMVVLLRTIPYFSEFQRSILTITETSAPLKKIVSVLTRPVEERKGPGKADYVEIGPVGNIKIKDLSFSYKDKEPVLGNINMEFKKGRMYAFVSLSGGGKSTLLDLMAHIRNPNKGAILFDNTAVGNINPKTLRGKVGYMNQEPLIFHDTIRENVTFFKREATDKEIDRALSMASVKDFIDSLPQGLETGLGERGLTVSGGERQRIGLSRVFLRDPEIMLLDETTNSLDYKAEKVIYDHLRGIKKDKIIVVAAHRLSSIVDFDEIIVLQNGRIQEKGRHEELMNNKGVYYSLFRLQEAGAIDEF